LAHARSAFRNPVRHVSTSYAEEQPQRAYALTPHDALTNGFSKKVENHAHAMALHFFYYNFVRIHKTLKVTPAMAACVMDRLWEVPDMVSVLEAWGAAQLRRPKRPASFPEP
jgi:hypothetical protein